MGCCRELALSYDKLLLWDGGPRFFYCHAGLLLRPCELTKSFTENCWFLETSSEACNICLDLFGMKINSRKSLAPPNLRDLNSVSMKPFPDGKTQMLWVALVKLMCVCGEGQVSSHIAKERPRSPKYLFFSRGASPITYVMYREVPREQSLPEWSVSTQCRCLSS